MLLAVYLSGGHWTVLQSVAWVNMVVSFSRTDSLPAALEKTFDGEHPCGLCKVVSEGQANEKKQDLAKVAVKLDAVLAPASVAPAPREGVAVTYFVSEASLRGMSFAPGTPPPRRA